MLILKLLVPIWDCIFFQGVAMPAMNNILSKWIPVSERSRSLALVYSGMYLGSVTGLAFSPMLIHKFGWPSVFYSFGSLGTVWFAIWLSKVTCLYSCTFINKFFLMIHCLAIRLVVCHIYLKCCIREDPFQSVLVIFLNGYLSWKWIFRNFLVQKASRSLQSNFWYYLITLYYGSPWTYLWSWSLLIA